MIEVGIQENIKITKAELRPDPNSNPLKDTLVLGLEIVTPVGSLTGSLIGAEDNVQDGNDQEYYLWPFDNKTREGNSVAPLSEILNRIKTFKAQLNHILKGYMVEAAIEKKWDAVVLQNTGVTDDNGEEMLIREDVVNKIYKNICNGFVELITPYISQPGSSTFRVKLIRQSKAKHFSRLPKFSPFWEDMSVLKEQSKLAFSKWEKENGFNSGTPSEDAPTPDSKPSAEEQKAVDDVFGKTD